MKRLSIFGIVFLAAIMIPPVLKAQVPTIATNGIVNGASFAAVGLPNSAIAQGSIFTIFGSNLGPTTYVQVDSFPLPTAPPGLAGTSISVTVGSTTVNAIMLWTLNTQVAAVLPSNTPVGAGTVRLTYNGQTSAPAPITVVARSFGIFALNQAGSGPGIIQNVNSESDRPFNATNRPARPQQIMILWGTGIGPVAGNEAGSALPGDMPNVNLRVIVGSQEAQIQYRGRSGCCVGIDQIVFVVPAGVSGCAVPVYIIVDGVVSNFVTISVAATGNTCSDGGLTEADINNANANGGLRIGGVTLTRGFSRLFGLFANPTPRVDNLAANYVRNQLTNVLSNSIPQPGTCTVTQLPINLPPGASTQLNVGTVTVNGPVGARTLVEQGPGSKFLTFLPGGFPGVPGVVVDGTVLTAGSYNFSVAGGSDVGAHSHTIDYPATFTWTQFDTMPGIINRGQPLVVNWTGGQAGATVVIMGMSMINQTVGVQFLCYADGAAGSFTVPGAITGTLPPSVSFSGLASGIMSVSHIRAERVPIPNIDLGSKTALDVYTHNGVTVQ
jgi:uncharacterized protein (TIGR03437 family)